MPKEFYFTPFEQRRPPPPLEYSPRVEFIWQVLATMNLTIGAWYIGWRWTVLHTNEWYSACFSVSLVLAETCAYFGLILFTFNLWRVKDTPRREPPRLIEECVAEPEERRPIKVDIFFPTYSEDPELVRLSIIDAKQITYPYPIIKQIYVLDDGHDDDRREGRQQMRRVAEEEGVNYITRKKNVGFKAGNLANAIKQIDEIDGVNFKVQRTFGDFIVICDADTRPFPTLLEHTLGYFRDPDVAWVQTPHWYYDIPEGEPLAEAWQRRFGRTGFRLARCIEHLAGPIQVGHDPLFNDPKGFYDIIQRRRNWVNASFCCGAGSVHRRKAVEDATERKNNEAYIKEKMQHDAIGRNLLTGIAQRFEEAGIAVEEEIIKQLHSEWRKRVRQKWLELLEPYKFHVSEDFYTSIFLHSQQHPRWKSVYHPEVESKMLSPQDLLSWTMQRFKYAGGTLDILLKEGIVLLLLRPVLSLGQRLIKYADGILDNIFLKEWNAQLLRPILSLGQRLIKYADGTLDILLSKWEGHPGLSLGQRLMYGATFWSYLSGIWNLVFLLAPITYLFTGVYPVSVSPSEFAGHIVPFLLLTELASIAGTWGMSGFKSKASYIAFFPVNLHALWTVLKGDQIKFPVTPKQRQEGNFFHLVLPQRVVALLTLISIAFAWPAWFIGLVIIDEYTLGGLLINTFWGGYHIMILYTFISTASWKPV